jgi:hypothetical protein
VPWWLLSVDALLESVVVLSDDKESCRRGGGGDGDVSLRFLYQV